MMNTWFSDLLDLVLLKRENVFYRGKVVDYNEDDFVVHFLDYGYTMLVSRKNIYQWHPMWNLVPGTNRFEIHEMKSVNPVNSLMPFCLFYL